MEFNSINEHIDVESRKETMYETLANTLENDILEGKFADGKLPSEQVITEKYNVSRTVVREGLKILSERKLINTINGSGTYITKPTPDDLSAVLNRIILANDIDYLEAFDLRLLLETAAAKSAAQNATDEEIDEIIALANQLHSFDLSNDIRISNELKFHMALISASHNKLLTILTKSISNIIYNCISLAIQADKKRMMTITHLDIAEALKTRNADYVEHALYSHLFLSKQLYIDYVTGSLN